MTLENLEIQKQLESEILQKKTKQENVEKKVEKDKKRRREIEKEEEFLSKSEIKISIPDNLKELLVQDWENVTKNKKVFSF